MSDNFVFATETTTKEALVSPWKVLIVDDEEHIHIITKTVLKNFSFEAKGLAFTSAYSSKEALDILQKDSDYALVLLDVVMEKQDSGLVLVQAIREVLNNTLTRIVLRTGEPNSAPEKRVIEQYEIHDYKDKTELNDVKLSTTVISALRSYRDLKKIKENEAHLESLVAEKTRSLETLNAELESRVKEQSLHMLQQSRYAEMGEALAMIAHQWKQPLGAISAILNNILSKHALGIFEPRVLPHDLHQIEDILRHLSSTIDAFGDFFKPSKTKEPCDIASLVESALQLTASSFTEHDIRVIKEFEVCPNIYSFKNELKQVVLNILNNAKDSLIEHQIKNPSIAITLEKQERQLRLCIYNNGGGIRKDIIDKIFEPYVSTKSKNGTGLGLYMSKVIIQEHCNGQIEVENIEDGVKFIITLPLDKA